MTLGNKLHLFDGTTIVSTIDIKAVYMGASGKSWAETSGAYLHRLYHEGSELTHNALEDAISQATIFEGILKEFFFLK